MQGVGQLGSQGGEGGRLGRGHTLIVEVDAGVAIGHALADYAADLGVLDGGVVEQSGQRRLIDDRAMVRQTQEAGARLNALRQFGHIAGQSAVFAQHQWADRGLGQQRSDVGRQGGSGV